MRKRARDGRGIAIWLHVRIVRGRGDGPGAAIPQCVRHDLQRIIHENSMRRAPYEKFYYLVKGESCVYCGEAKECLDHFLPISRLAQIIHLIPEGTKFPLLPSCASCNSLASDQIAYSIDEKRELIRAQIRKTFKAILALKWTEEEISQLGFNLQTRVRGDMERKAWLLRRIKQSEELSQLARTQTVEKSMRSRETGRNSVPILAELRSTLRIGQKLSSC